VMGGCQSRIAMGLQPILYFSFVSSLALDHVPPSLECTEKFSVVVGEMVWGVTALPVSGLVVAPSLDHSVYLWNISSGKQLRRLYGHADEVWRVVKVSDSDHPAAVTASLDGTVKLWNFSNETFVSSRTLFSCEFMVTALASTDDYIAHGDKGGQIGLWKNLVWVGKLLEDGIMVQALVLLPGARLLSGHDNGMIRLWDLSNQTQTRSWRAYNSTAISLAARSDGGFVASGYDVAGVQEPWSLHYWDHYEGQQVSSTSSFGIVTALAFLPWSHLLALGGPENKIYFVDVLRWDVHQVVTGHAGAIHALHPFGTGFLLSGGTDREVKMWRCTEESCNIAASE